MTINLAQQITAAKRELKIRRDVFPARVRTGKMKQGVADYEIEVMAAILSTLENLKAGAEKGELLE